jgi:hypothetical protein
VISAEALKILYDVAGYVNTQQVVQEKHLVSSHVPSPGPSEQECASGLPQQFYIESSEICVCVVHLLGLLLGKQERHMT